MGVVGACASTGAAGNEQDDVASVASTVAPEPTTPPAATNPTVPTAAPPSTTSPRPTTTGPATTVPATTVPATTVPATTVPATTSTTSPVERADWAVFDYALADRLIGGGDQAASVAVAVDGKIVHRSAFGSRVPGERAHPADRFRIASISKPMASAATLRLVEAGKLKLDQPALALVAKSLNVPVVDPAANTVTVRQLLGHKSGIGSFEFELLYAGSNSCEHAARIALSESLVGKPGKSYRYSNMNYCLIGLVLEAVTGQPYETVIRKQVLDPVGAGAMRVAGTRDRSKRSVLHVTSPGRNYMDTLGASGSWISSASDVVRFADSLDPAKAGWHPVSNRTLALMKAPVTKRHKRGRPRLSWYGLGLVVFSDGSYGHTGTLENTHAMVVVRPDGVTWAVLVSGENPWETSDLRTMVDNALFAALAPR